jgi:translation elongation factor EF-Tu-like GTPase
MQGKQIGDVFHYFDKAGVAAIRLTKSLKLGDTIRIVGGEVDFTDVISSIQIDENDVESAKAGDEVGIKVSEKARKGYKVYKVK